MNEAAKQEQSPSRSLVKKLAQVMGEVERIAKNGRNDSQKYDYATEADIAAAVREHMASRNLILVPTVEKTEWEKRATRSGGEMKLCTLTVKFTLMDGDSGEEKEFTVLGQGEDTGDKATYKAMTGATKYALMKLFLIPTGDDPEKDSETRFTPAREAADTSASTPVRKASNLPGSKAVIKFGEGKGKMIADLTDTELAWQIDAVTKAVRAQDPKWHKLNLQRQADLQAEAQMRLTSAGKIVAPATTSPRQAELPTEEDEGEEILTASQRFFQLARESGLSGAQLTARAKGVLNKTTNWTHADIDLLTASLRAVPA